MMTKGNKNFKKNVLMHFTSVNRACDLGNEMQD